MDGSHQLYDWHCRGICDRAACGRSVVDIYVAFYDGSCFGMFPFPVFACTCHPRGLLSKNLWKAKHCETTESSGIGHKPVPCPEKTALADKNQSMLLNFPIIFLIDCICSSSSVMFCAAFWSSCSIRLRSSPTVFSRFFL